MSKINEQRRALLLASAAASASTVLSSSPSLAQDSGVPSRERTIQFLNSSRSAALLYNQFGLIWSLLVSIYLYRNGANAINIVNLDLTLPPFTSGPSIFPTLSKLASPDDSELRESAKESITNSDPFATSDPLVENLRSEQNKMLVRKISSEIDEIMISINVPIIGDAIESISHVERIASVTDPPDVEDDQPDSERSYLCRVFPFNYFCGQ